MKKLTLLFFLFFTLRALAQPTPVNGGSGGGGGASGYADLDDDPRDDAVLAAYLDEKADAAALAAKAEALTVSSLGSTALVLASKEWPVKTATWSTNQTLTFTGGTSAAGQGVVIEANVTQTITLTITPTSATVYRNGAPTALSAPFTVYPGRHTFTFYTNDDGSTLELKDTVYVNMTDVQWAFPEWYGSSVTRNAVDGVSGYGHCVFSGSAAKTNNFVIYRWFVPKDYDQSIPPTFFFLDRLAAADTGSRRYEVSYASLNSSDNIDSASYSGAFNVDIPADASGASGDVEIMAEVSTGWTLTPGRLVQIKVARVGDDGTNDTSTQNSQEVKAGLYYHRTQP